MLFVCFYHMSAIQQHDAETNKRLLLAKDGIDAEIYFLDWESLNLLILYENRKISW